MSEDALSTKDLETLVQKLLAEALKKQNELNEILQQIQRETTNNSFLNDRTETI